VAARRTARSSFANSAEAERLANITAEQKRKFLPSCPDFVIELRSPSDPRATLQAKM
jgi:Uma2 family endonuclease